MQLSSGLLAHLCQLLATSTAYMYDMAYECQQRLCKPLRLTAGLGLVEKARCNALSTNKAFIALQLEWHHLGHMQQVHVVTMPSAVQRAGTPSVYPRSIQGMVDAPHGVMLILFPCNSAVGARRTTAAILGGVATTAGCLLASFEQLLNVCALCRQVQRLPPQPLRHLPCVLVIGRLIGAWACIAT